MIRKSKKIIKKLKNYRTIKVLGVKVDFVNLEKTLSLVEKWKDTDKQYQITTPNPEHIILSQDDYRFKKIINNSDLAIADGVGLVWAARMLFRHSGTTCHSGTNEVSDRILSGRDPIALLQDDTPHRLSGIDLMQALCKLAARKNWRVFLLGGKRAAKVAALNLKAQSSKLKTTTQNSKFNLNISYFDGTKDIRQETASERNKAIKKINNFKPHLLFVAYGAPMQEKWIAKNMSQLNVKVAMGVGGAFDYLAYEVKRAPKWMQNIGLEWFWRLVCQPWRWRRQLRLVRFVWLVIKERLLFNCY